MTTEHTWAQRLSAEFLGTFVLVLGGCGAAVLASGSRPASVGHRLPRRLVGLRARRPDHGLRGRPHLRRSLQPRGDARPRDGAPVPLVGTTLAYIVTQVVGGGGRSHRPASSSPTGAEGFDRLGVRASPATGSATAPPAATPSLAALVAEVVLTAVFLYVILGVTDTRAPKGFAPLAIGLALTLIHLVSIPVSNTSVNPARSIGPALFAGGDAIGPAVGLLGSLRSSAARRRGDVRPPLRQGRRGGPPDGRHRGLSAHVLPPDPVPRPPSAGRRAPGTWSQVPVTRSGRLGSATSGWVGRGAQCPA